MKQYEKPAIEIIEANLSADCLQGETSIQSAVGASQVSSSKKDTDDEDLDFGDGW